jgi:hypothetical protein
VTRVMLAEGLHVPQVGLVQHVGWFDPVGRHVDRLAAHKELQHFLSPRENLVGAAVRGLQSPAFCVLTMSVQLWRSLCMNVAGEAWRAAGNGLGRTMC